MSEQVTEEQLAQCFLSANALPIIRGAHRDIMDGDGKTEVRFGPPLIAVKRIKGTEKLNATTNAPPLFGVNASIDSEWSSVGDLANMFSMKDETRAFCIIPGVEKHMKPNFRFLKLYPYDKSDGTPGWTPVPIDPRTFPYKKTDPETGKDPAVIVKKIEWQQLGGNPAEIDSNIAFQVELYAHDLSNYFTPWWPQSRAATRSDQRYPENVRTAADEGVRWIDLIQINTGQRCERLYDHSQSRIRVEVGYKDLTDGDIDDLERLYTTFVNVHGSHKASCGQCPDEEEKTVEELIVEFQEMLRAQTKVYDLNLLSHEFTYGSRQEVTLKIDYIASIEMSQRTEMSDLFNDHGLGAYTAMKKEELAILNQRVGSLQPIQADAAGVLTETQRKMNETRGDARARLQEEITKLQQDIANANIRAKKRLLNQLLLGKTYGKQAQRSTRATSGLQENRGVSRVYWIGVPKATLYNTVVYGAARHHDAEPADPIRVHNYESLLQGNTSGIAAGRYVLRNNSRQGDSPTDREDGRTSRFNVYEPTDERHEQEIRELYGASSEGDWSSDQWLGTDIDEGGVPAGGIGGTPLNADGKFAKKLIKFVFFGDIIEAALEIIGQNLYVEKYQNAARSLPGVTGTSQIAPPDFATDARYNWENMFYGFDPTFFGGDEAESGPDQRGISRTTQEELHERDKREKLVTALLGEIIIGDVTMPKPLHGANESWGPRGSRTINIADIPISWDRFRSWWMRVAVSKPNMTKLYFREFMIKLLTDLLPNAIGKGCSWIAEDHNPTQFLMNNYSVMGDDVVLKAQYSEALEKHAHAPHLFPLPLLGRYITGDEIQAILHKNNESGGGDPDNRPVTNISAIQMRPVAGFVGDGDPCTDLKRRITHIRPPGSAAPITKDLKFTREDMPYLREANIDAGPLGIFREKYNATIQILGNSMYKPGGMVYINPNTLSLGLNKKSYLQGNIPDEIHKMEFELPGISKPFYRRGHQALGGNGMEDITPYARLVGLGGYYVLNKITHSIFQEGGGKYEWHTTYDAKWVAFKGEADNCDEMEEPPPPRENPDVATTSITLGTVITTPTR